jgi:Ca-activated chloride channel homolog
VQRTACLSAIILAVLAFCAQSGNVLPVFAQTASAPQDPVSTPAPGSSITIPAGQKFIMQLETDLHTRTTKTGDRVEFTTAADVVVDDQVVIPNKSPLRGTVIKAKRAGRLFGRAEIHLRFDDVRLTDGTVVPLKATITRVGFDPVDPKNGQDPKIQGEAGAGAADAKTIASASAQGAIIGVMTGSLNGAMYGAAAGAAVAVAQMALKRGPDLDLPRRTMFEARFDGPMTIPEKSLQAQSAPADVPEQESQLAAAAPDQERPANTQVAESRPNVSGEEEKIAATRPVLKRRIPSSEEPAASGASEAPPADASAKAEPPNAPPVAAEPPKSSLPPAEPPKRAAAEPRAAESTTPTISVKVRLVQVDAVVRDRSGRMIDNLTIDDFRVYEDGVLQQIQGFSRDELPLAVALVVDRSGSVAPYISELRRIATRALNQLKPEDEVCLFSFAATVDRLENLTTDRRRIADAISGIHAGGGTDITDALHDSVLYLSRAAPGRRHAVILISDNQQTVNPQSSDAETVKTAMETETVVYSLKTSGAPFQIAAQLPAILFGGDPVSKVTQETGGEIISVGHVSSLDSALGAVISRLRMRYSLSYYPSGTAQGGAFHEIKVRLTDSHGKAGNDYFMHAKRGYYATGTSSRAAATESGNSGLQ